jgi:hypothetical protein
VPQTRRDQQRPGGGGVLVGPIGPEQQWGRVAGVGQQHHPCVRIDAADNRSDDPFFDQGVEEVVQ